MIMANKVRDKGRGSRRAARLLGCLALIFFLALFLTGRYHAIDRLGYEKAAMARELRMLEREHQALTLVAARLQSMERVNEVATGHLGMVRTAASVELGPLAEPVVTADEGEYVILAFANDHASDLGHDPTLWGDLGAWFSRLFFGVARAAPGQ